ncbi:MAG: AAA family ATPase [Sneathiella sp.]
MQKIYLIVGNVGAGKSTYAANFALQKQAHIFTIDEWMKNLFWMEAPEGDTYEWALERIVRIETQILTETIRLSRLGVPIILDLGFFSADQRTRVQSRLLDEDLRVQTLYLDVDKEERWRRIQQRNSEQGQTYQFTVSREVFDFCETIFEPMDEAELATATIVHL